MLYTPTYLCTIDRARTTWRYSCSLKQWFLSQSKIKYFLDTLIQKRFFLIKKINNLQGELTDVSAKKEAQCMAWRESLSASDSSQAPRERQTQVYAVILMSSFVAATAWGAVAAHTLVIAVEDDGVAEIQELGLCLSRLSQLLKSSDFVSAEISVTSLSRVYIFNIYKK